MIHDWSCLWLSILIWTQTVANKNIWPRSVLGIIATVHNPCDHIPDSGYFSVGKTLYNQSFSIFCHNIFWVTGLCRLFVFCVWSLLWLSKHLLIGITMTLTIRTHIALWWPWVSRDMGGPRVSKIQGVPEKTLVSDQRLISSVWKLQLYNWDM